MICPSCAHENRPSAKFCEECATPLARVCSSCGSELRPTAKFCDACATPVAANGAGSAPAGSAGPSPAAVTAAGPAAGTRKIVTIVFADLAGSTAMQERLDPESVRRFMESYYDAMRDAVESHGGTLTQFLGDGVKAVFGIPRVAEDDAIRAVRAGVAMQKSFRALADSQHGAVGTVGLRVAINTGEVVANADDEIIGDPVNVAARLQEQGGDGDVVVGESTARLVAALVTLEPLGSFALKGRAGEVAAFRLESLDRPAGAATAAFVGRDDELACISSVYQTAVDKPATALAVLLGSPGLGKSRLIDEFARRLGDSANVVTAHCDEASLATFAPLADALREQLGIEAGARPESLRPSIESAIPTDNADRIRIAGGIAALLAGSPASPEETFFVVRRLFAALASVQPVVLVIDDLQWAEPLLLDLVEHLVQWGSGVPLLVLVGARPELRDLRSSLVTPGGLVSEVVTLGGLDAGAAMRLAANVIGATDLPAVVAAKVLATSEGNPLFVGELVRMLVFEGALKREGARWTTGTALEALEMPPTIHALLAARIERLRPDERIVLERAAVVGRHFSRSAVAELLPHDTSDLDARLESLLRSELIHRDTGWFLGEPVLRFHHVLIRDAAYRQLLKRTRAELHERFANWVEARAGSSTEHDETIGWHLEQAHQHLSELGPISAAGRVLGERASTRLAAEGRRALARDDLSVASSLLGRAIARLDPDDPARADLALDWCEALLAAGDVGPAAGAIDELDRFVGDSERLRAWHTCFAGEHAVLTAPEGLPDTADAVAAAADVMAAQGDAAGEAKAHFVHALVFRRLGKIGACEAALDRALAAARRVAGDRRRANTVLAIAPLAALWGPSPVTRASGRCLDVVRVLRITQGAPAVEAVALSCQGVLEALRGRTDAAHRMIASARKMVEELGITQRLLEADVFSAQVELLEGDAPAAERNLRGAYHGLRELGLGIDAARAAALLARALLAQDHVAEAETLSHESEVLAGDDLKAAIAWRGVRAEALARRGEHAAAVEFATEAVQLAAATDALLDHADARLALAAALRAAGRGREADAEERRAHELWEAKGATLLADRARSEGARGAAVTAHPEELRSEVRTVRRRVRPNLATAVYARFCAAVDARDFAAVHAIYAESYRATDYPTGSTYGRDESRASMERLFRSRGAYYRAEPVATLGKSLALFKRWSGARSTGGGRYDVGEYESEAFHVVEADESGCIVHTEIFAADQLRHAVSRLYQSYSEQLPESPARTRIEKVAVCMARMMSAPNDLESLAEVLAPELECIDHRHLSLWSGRGAEEFLQHRHALTRVAENIAFDTSEILALEVGALVSRVMHSGTDREGGGPYERPFLSVFGFDADGRIAHLEWFDDDHETDALARFDEITVETGTDRPVPRRVRPNAASRNLERQYAALVARDAEAAGATLSEQLVAIHHPTGATYGAAEAVASFRWLFESRHTRFAQELLATLGDSLALVRQANWSDAIDAAQTGPAEATNLLLSEVDDRGLTNLGEVFANDHLGEAILRLYERYAEQLPEDTARARAEATARCVGSAAIATWDPDRRAEAYSPDVQIINHRVLGSASPGGRENLFRSMDAMTELADDVVSRGLDLLALTDNALLLRWLVSGVGRDSGGAFESAFLRLFVFGSDGRVVHYELFEDEREAEALARFETLVGGSAPEPAVASRLRANAASAAAKRMAEALASRAFGVYEALLDVNLEAIDHRSHTRYGREGVLETVRRFMQPTDATIRSEPIATLGEWLGLSHHSITASGSSAGRFDVGEHETEYLDFLEVDRAGVIQRHEFFATDRLSDALVRLYERFAELVPEGPERERATTTARAVDVFSGPIDLEKMTAALNPSAVNIDHRNLGTWSAHGAEEFLRHWRLQLELTQGWSVRVDAVLAVASNALLDRRSYFGIDRATGGTFENRVLALWVFGGDGRLDSVEVWEPDDEAAALARFDERVATPDRKRAPRFANAATRAMENFVRCWRARDWDGFAAPFAANFRYSDRRRIAQLELDQHEYIAFVRELGDLQSHQIEWDVLATRGDRLSLTRIRQRFSDGNVGPSEIEFLDLHELDEGGRVTEFVRFESEDRDAAYAELEARFEAGEASSYPRLRASLASSSRIDARDWPSYAAGLAPDFVYRDHRLLGWGDTGYDAESLIRLLQSAVDLSPDARYRHDHVRVAARGVMRQTALVGTRDGGAFENPMFLVLEVDEQGRTASSDTYDIEDFDRALARFAELSVPVSAGSPFANTAMRVSEQLSAAWEAQDWDRFAAGLTAHFRASDRRRAVQLELDRDEFIGFVRSTGDMQSTRMRSELLATRGDRLVLAQLWIELAGDDVGPSEITHLSLFEVDEQGTPTTTIRWDEEDLGAAYAELDARFVAGEGATQPHVQRAHQALGDAWRNADWDALAACCAPGFTYSDHRLLGFGEILDDAQKWAHSQRVLVELAPDTITRLDHVRLSSGGALRQLTQLGTRDGGAFETSFFSVVSVSPHGAAERMDLYDLDRFHDARAHFDALAPAAAPAAASDPPFANAATRFNERFVRCWDARDWKSVTEMRRPTCQVDDRRRLMALESSAEDNLRFWFEQPRSHWIVTPIATRGEHLSLSRLVLGCAIDEEGGDAAIDYLAIDELDREGFNVAVVTFDPDEFDAAYAELDDRWRARDGAGHPVALAWLRDFDAALASRDWDALGACFAPACVGEDYRLVGWGSRRGPAAIVEVMRAMVDLAPDARFRWNHLRVSGRAVLADAVWLGTRDGGAFESPLAEVVVLDAQGRALRLDFYDAHHIDRALARFEELTAAAPPSSHPFPNAATRDFDRQIRYFLDRDWSGFRDLLPAGFRYIDRRRVAQLELDADQFIAFIQPLGEMASTRLVAEPLATRGDRLALVRMHFEGAGGDVGPSEIDDVSVIEADEQGRCIERIRFDGDDLDAAYVELDARWQAGLGPEHPKGFLRKFTAALTRRDWDAVADCYAPAFVGVDHRLVGWGTLRGPAAFVRPLQEMVSLAPDALMRMHHVRSSGGGSIHDAAWLGTRDGGAFESPFVSVNEFDPAGKVARADFYDPHHLDRALARFEEICANGKQTAPLAASIEPNAASEWLQRFLPVFNARDWDRARDLYAPDIGYEDRQRYSRVSGDLGMLMSSIRERAEAGARLERAELLGTAGARVAVQRTLWGGGGSGDRFEMEFLVVQQVDEAGRLAHTINFDVDDARAAQREMWALWAGIEPHVASFTTPYGELIDAFNAQDRDRWRAQLADDLVVDDHRRTGFGRLEGADAYADSVSALWELAPDTQVDAGWHWLAYDRHGAIADVRRTGVIPDGGNFESEYLNLFTASGGRITHIELFEVDAAEAALARFEELRPDPLRIPPNAVTRAQEPMARLLAEGDVEALRALASDDFCFDDRSKRAQLRGGVEEWLRALEFLRREIRGQPESHLLATAGDRLALHRVVWTESSGDAPFVIENLRLVEIDPAGKLRALVLFEPNERAAAREELFDRWAATGALPDGHIAFTHAINDHDLASVRAALTDDVVIEDHRRTGYGRLEGAEAYVASAAAAFELSPDARWDTLYRIAEGPHGFLDLTCLWGTNAEGGDFESPFIALGLFRGDQLYAGEMFEIDKLDLALARFEALRPDPLAIPSTAATRARDRIKAAFLSRDWDALRALAAADFVYDDRGKRALVRGDIETLISSNIFSAQPGMRVDITLLGSIGDRLTVDRLLWFGEPGGDAFEFERIRLLEMNADGQLSAAIYFDPDDRAAAFAEVQARFLAGEGAQIGGQAPTAKLHAAFARRDWDALRATFAPGAAFYDHRTLGFGALEIDVWIDSLRAHVELAADLAFEGIQTLACNRHGRVSIIRSRGTNAEGGAFENLFVLVHCSRGDQLLCHETFECEDAERALARFEALCEGPGS